MLCLSSLSKLENKLNRYYNQCQVQQAVRKLKEWYIEQAFDDEDITNDWVPNDYVNSHGINVFANNLDPLLRYNIERKMLLYQWMCYFLLDNQPKPDKTVDLVQESKSQIHDVSEVTMKKKNVFIDLHTIEHLLKCRQLQRLKTVLYQCKTLTANTNDECDPLIILNDFIYLLLHHNSDEEFYYLYHVLGDGCDANECQRFKRRYGDKHQCINTELITDILDKVHCFYAHTFDIGYRVKNANRSCVNQPNSQEIFDILKDETIVKLTQALRIKNNLCKAGQSKVRISNKYNTMPEDIESNDEHYCFGVSFCYEQFNYDHDTNIMHVFPKFQSLKEECIQNDICVLSVEQFNNENDKAMLHFNSDYRKEEYRLISIEHILSLMMYSNFDHLQYEFSKTYRKSYADKHNNYYHWGKFLKSAVHEFGTDTMYVLPTFQRHYYCETNFFHGITGKLLFPEYTRAIMINAPVSTSSSFAVATNFANYNGLVIEFTGERKNKVFPILHSAKHFSMSWLSDYPNEMEHLFIQQKAPLQIASIVDLSAGIDHRFILHALKLVNEALYQEQFGVKVGKQMKSFVQKLINHQLSVKLSEFESHKQDFNPYTQKIIDTYFNSVKKITLHQSWKTDNILDLSVLFDLKLSFFKFYRICSLFPYVELIVIEGIQNHLKAEYTVMSILIYLQQFKHKCNIKQIYITTGPYECIYDVDVHDLCVGYTEEFESINFNILVFPDWINLDTDDSNTESDSEDLPSLKIHRRVHDTSHQSDFVLLSNLWNNCS
eukprot:198285_1